MAELPVCAVAMLTAIVTSEESTLGTDELLVAVPFTEPALGCDDILAWFDHLQLLLDQKLVTREAAPYAYLYRPTVRGVEYVYGNVVVRQANG